jgi:PhzF family phenazine biosynthesis protein
MKTPKIIYQVDAFTSLPFKGNPAGVCILEEEPSAGWMQNIAMEMNLSETAFVFGPKDLPEIRFYTPEIEVKLCGHATLSASHILYETRLFKGDEQIRFSSKAGELSVRKADDWITMNFPVFDLENIGITDEFERITGVQPEELYRTGYGWILALLKSEEDVRHMTPDFSLLKKSEFGDLIVTAKSEEQGFDFCFRCFAPVAGINEDPVTGSAHCALVPFWNMKTGRTEFISHQLSKRTGVLKVSRKNDRVEISGQAKTILRAELLV